MRCRVYFEGSPPNMILIVVENVVLYIILIQLMEFRLNLKGGALNATLMVENVVLHRIFI